ncbi:hypothetical protein B0T16DRAFT_399942 [Cercophora newfieldiana]|uniref:Transfer RNA methyltransferase 82 n=1 Tax=Cercophora newfieldiana TaxID=92897 RepID=A0AA40D144_9PEZI|nr:hypothetical protein B0T16DRAFT_399942 [Cercophora newfieldiana]
MVVPYHLLTACGSVLFAARGSDIYSFTPELQPISTWKYPSTPQNGSSGPSSAPQASPAAEGPPSKRRKLESGQNGDENGHEKGEPAEPQAPVIEGKKHQDPTHQERSFIHGLTATSDHRHVVAISGSDKTIWVFEHDGAGHFKLLSHRTMPKRPCAIVITADNHTILSADKFGDVYSIPLIPSPSNTTTPAPSSRSATPSTTQNFKPQANEFTVHTRRNLKALENQKLGLQARAADKPAEPTFEHTLLLGHVSMLTAVTVGTHPTTRRPYIITADRDEHIRVSRGEPSQAHIIDAFCLGHEDFVSRLCIPARSPEILISGGGDDDLFVWNWSEGRLLAHASVLEQVKKLVPEASKVAVSRIFAFPEEDGTTSIFVICERVPAVFCYRLQENRLQHSKTISTGGNVLDITAFPRGSRSEPDLVLAVDPLVSPEGVVDPSLIILTRDSPSSSWMPDGPQKEALVVEGESIKQEELQKLLYFTESLRKTSDFE